VALVGLAGILIVAATFLPWVAQQGVSIEESVSHPFQGGTAERSFSGWELEQRCGQPDGFGSCSLPAGSFEGRRSIFTGAWTLVVGVSFVVVAGAMSLAIIRGWRIALRCLLVVSWLVSITAVVVGMSIWWVAADLPSSTSVPPSQPGPGGAVLRQLPEPVRYGIITVAAGAALGVVGTGIATFFGSRKAPRTSDGRFTTAASPSPGTETRPAKDFEGRT
jgi:hypothetical protein